MEASAASPPGTPAAPRVSLLRSALEYSIGSGLGLVGSILRVGVTARLLSPEARGLWLGLQVAFGYAQNLHFGTLYGMFRMVPMLRGRGDVAGAEAAKRTTAGFVVVLTSVAWVVLGGYALLSRDAGHTRYYVLTGVLTTATLLRSYYGTLFKAESRFRDVSISATIGGATSILSIALVWWAGLDGLIWGMTIQALLESSWFMSKQALPGLSLDKTVLRELLHVGVMTLIVTLATLALGNVDRTVMLARLGTGATGNYYIGANILVLVPAVSALPADVLSPRFFENYGATGRGDSLVDLVERPVRAGSVLFAALLGMGVLAMPPVVWLLWPGLMSGLDAARLAALSTFPVIMMGLATKVFYAMNRQAVQVVIIAASAALGFSAAHVAASLSPTLTSIVAASSLGLFANYLFGMLAAYRLMEQSLRSGITLVAQSMLPLALAALLVLLGQVVGDRFLPATSFVRCAVSEVVFCACFAPWILWAGRLLRPRPVR